MCHDGFCTNKMNVYSYIVMWYLLLKKLVRFFQNEKIEFRWKNLIAETHNLAKHGDSCMDICTYVLWIVLQQYRKLRLQSAEN